jgi:uncharacterized protein YabN with tetrapyrrole methylase and pyrophosphatase domain
MTTASLTLVGSGIKFYSHLTHECKSYINQSDLVLYLVNDPAMKLWIKNNSKKSESLDDIYVQHTDRLKCYHAITSYILKCVNDNQHVCVVLYGHPCVYSMPGLNAIKKAENEGFDTCILPGISAEDCLFADLKIDPSTIGCQSFEATDYLVYRRKLDTTCHVIFWQIDAIGLLDHSILQNKLGLELLLNNLTQHYPPHHEVIIYEAAQYACFHPRITRICLKEIVDVSLTKISTLYVPPTHRATPDQEILRKLNLG